MRIIIFAGGIGTRLWPMSRKNSPKQFDKIFNGKSTLELAIARVEPLVGIDNVYVQTTEDFKNILKEQIPHFRDENIFVEPLRRNVGPAVCYGIMKLKEKAMNDAVALLWADHLMARENEFRKALQTGEKLINKDCERFIFLAERPRFANHNIGWIKVGEKLGETDGDDYFKFLGWKYRPEAQECDQMFKSGDYHWNSGYFVSSVEFILNQYKNLSPEIYENVEKTIKEPENAIEHYGKAEKISFDKAVIEKTNLSNAVVIKTNMGWSDPGTLYALKEALEDSRDANVISGNVVTLNTKDSLLYNLEDKKLLAAIGLDGFAVVNTKDAIIIVPKDEVIHISKLVDKIDEQGYNEYL